MTISSTVNETTVTVNGTGNYTVTVSGTDSLYRPIHTLRNKTVIVGKIHIHVHVHCTCMHTCTRSSVQNG